MSSSSRFVLDIPNTKMAFSVSANGWLADHNPGGKEGYFSSSTLDTHVADGQNTVTLSVDRSERPHSPLDRFEVRIRSAAGETYHYEWEPGDPKRPLPFEATGHFTAHLPHGPYTWQRASKVTLDAPTKDGLNAFIRRVYGALDTKNLDESAALFSTSARENYVARDLPPAEAASENRDELAKTFADPHWRMDPIDFTRLKYTVIIGGRVVQVTRADGGYVLRNAGEPQKSYDIVFCLVGGQWTMVS